MKEKNKDDVILKKHQVHLLPTEKKISSNLILVKWNDGYTTLEQRRQFHTKFIENPHLYGEGVSMTCQEIYITSDEEIKEDDWYITNNNLFQFKGKPDWLDGHEKKIVACTNPELWTKNESGKMRNPETNEFIPFQSYWFGANNISCISSDFIEAYVKAYNEGKEIKEVVLEGVYNTAIRNDGCPFYIDKNGKYMAHDEHGCQMNVLPSMKISD
jgi:hypothetical protein